MARLFHQQQNTRSSAGRQETPACYYPLKRVLNIRRASSGCSGRRLACRGAGHPAQRNRLKIRATPAFGSVAGGKMPTSMAGETPAATALTHPSG